jgi:hypothetical protein
MHGLYRPVLMSEYSDGWLLCKNETSQCGRYCLCDNERKKKYTGSDNTSFLKDLREYWKVIQICVIHNANEESLKED